MVKYFEELFATMNEEENILIGSMIYRIGNENMSFDTWVETMSEEERAFAHALLMKVDEEYFHLLEEASAAGMSAYEYHLFAEIMLYYTTYNVEMGWAVPSIGKLYGSSVERS